MSLSDIISDVTSARVPNGRAFAVPVIVTPELAAKWLETNVSNRPPSIIQEKKYAKEMERNEWVFNGDVIKFYDTGNLFDGQHRLMACVRSGVSFPTFVVLWIESKESFFTTDKGLKRTVGHDLAVMKIPSYNMMATAFKAVIGHLFNKHTGNSYHNTKNVMKLIELYPDMQECIRIAASMLNRGVKYMPETQLAFLLFGARMDDKEGATQFFEKLITGVGLQDRTTVYALHKKLVANSMPNKQKEKLSRVHLSLICIKAWNKHRQGESISKIPLAPGEVPEFEAMARLRDDITGASTEKK